jgi:diketogulonate reductase-like aldo/keto reductase
VAGELDSPPARVALAWVQSRPNVTSTIIGARTMDQLEQNLASLDVTLSPAQQARLTDLSTPKLDFPHGFLKSVRNLHHNGATVNGEKSVVFRPALPQPY